MLLTCFKKIFDDVKYKDTVLECEINFRVLPVSDGKEEKFLVKYGLLYVKQLFDLLYLSLVSLSF